jgi:agmatine deiminase
VTTPFPRESPVHCASVGGSIDVNGNGLLLTTESCLLNPNRNPNLSRTEIEGNLKESLGINKVLWLGRGIAGDDTDGHVDDLTRFFAPDGIVTAVESDPGDVNHEPLRENLERLRAFRKPGGGRFRIVELPMPAPCFARGRRLAASYANFLIINGAVLMPTFRQPRNDSRAAKILSNCFPGMEIIPIDSLYLVRGGGSIHCISQQQPAADRQWPVRRSVLGKRR